MKEIPLTKGAVAIVDDDDWAELVRHKWYLTTSGYAARDVWVPGGKKNRVYMHREIAKTPEGMDTDHVNNKRLDNRGSNLRSCTRSENLRNSGIRSDNKTGYKGTAFHKFSGLYHSTIKANGKQQSLGYFKTIEGAARAYNEAAIKYFGEFAKLNDIK